MGKPPSAAPHTAAASVSGTTISDNMPSENLSLLVGFFNDAGLSRDFPATYSTKDFYSSFVRGGLSVHRLERGRVTCLLSVKPPVTNFYGGMHGGAVAAVAEILSIACARTMVAEERELFLGELSISYLSPATVGTELIVEGCIVRSGRSVTATTVEFKLKETEQLVYTARATFYNMPVAKL